LEVRRPQQVKFDPLSPVLLEYRMAMKATRKKRRQLVKWKKVFSLSETRP